ncbi:MAG: hypothetical protein LBS00_03775 [Synergistaceae bacterium]|jgi:hypothetical protein|nr:hypothetical protein [Synergistaceae bacterium]
MGLGPSTKETTLHYYRDPLCQALAADADVDFTGVVVAGTSDENEHKFFIAQRIGTLLEAMRTDGALISIDSWGNCHIDFASVMEAAGERGIPLVGLSFVGTQAAFVVTNSYMTPDSIIDLNKTSEGEESRILGQNTAVELDALKAVAILKNKIRRRNSEKLEKKRWAGEEKKEKAEKEEKPEKRVRRLILRTFAVGELREVGGGEPTKLHKGCLSINTEKLFRAGLSALENADGRVRKFSLSLITPEKRDVSVNSILDFAPVAAKVAGRAGEGITHVFSGLRTLLTAVEEGGFQPANMGSADGVLDRRVVFGRPGTPGGGDGLLHVDVLLAEGQGRSRAGIMAAHEVCDAVAQELRETLRALPSSDAAAKEEFWDIVRPNGYKIALVKLVSGLGCRYDTLLFPREPAGYAGGKSIMDRSNNVQIVITPNEYRDGVLHALT